MLKRTINHAAIELTIEPIDPLLIKSGQATVSGTDMAFVQTYRFGADPEPFIPGSSLKGVIRSYAEKICRSLRQDPVPVCLPYVEPGKERNGEQKQASCGLRIEQINKNKKDIRISATEAYRLSCPACRTFGSHGFIGRLATSDAYLTESFKKNNKCLLELRDGVAIDRLTGGPVGKAKYDLEVLTKGEFLSHIDIHNFERWQLGLVGLVLRDLEEGLIRIGLGKSRGLGRIRGKVTRFTVTYFGKPQEKLVGLAAACSEAECKAYGLFGEAEPGQALPEHTQDGLRYSYDLTSEWRNALESGVQDLIAYLDKVTWPTEFDAYSSGGKDDVSVRR